MIEEDRQDSPFEQTRLKDQISILNKKCELFRHQLQNKSEMLKKPDENSGTD
jgi:hypothetical protein